MKKVLIKNLFRISIIIFLVMVFYQNFCFADLAIDYNFILGNKTFSPEPIYPEYEDDVISIENIIIIGIVIVVIVVLAFFALNSMRKKKRIQETERKEDKINETEKIIKEKEKDEI